MPEPDPRRACLISNSGSGANLEHGLARVEDVAAAAGLRHQRLDDMSELAGMLRNCAERGDEVIFVNAGDGTVCRVLEHIRNDHLFSREPALILLRGGTTNMIHHDVGVAGRPADALRRCLESLEHGHWTYCRRHVLRVSSPSLRRPLYGFFLGTHAAVKAIRRTRARLHPRGATGAFSEMLSVAAMIWRLTRRRVERDPVLSPTQLSINRGDGWREEAHIVLLLLSLRTAILGLRPLRQGQRAGCAGLSWPDYRLLPWMWRFLRGRLEAFETIALRGDFEWILDGEIYAHREIDGDLKVDVDVPAGFLVPGATR